MIDDLTLLLVIVRKRVSSGSIYSRAFESNESIGIGRSRRARRIGEAQSMVGQEQEIDGLTLLLVVRWK